MRLLLGILALGFLGAVCFARPSDHFRHSLKDDSEKTLIRVLRSDLEEEEPARHKRVHKKRSSDEKFQRKRRAAEEDEFFQALLSRSGKTKSEQKRSYDDKGADNKGFIIRDDWKGDSKISDADRAELENLFSAINSPQEEEKEKIEEKRSPKDDKMKNLVEWLVSQPPKQFEKSLDHMVDFENYVTKQIFNDSAPAPTNKSEKQSDDALSDAAAKNKFYETRCYDINVAGINCRIISHPPKIDTTGGMQMAQQLSYPPYTGQVPCLPSSCTPQNPCSPPGCTPQYSTSGYPQAPGYPQSYGSILPPQNIYPWQYPGAVNPMERPRPMSNLRHHQHGAHHGLKHDTENDASGSGMRELTKQRDPIDPTEIDHEYVYEGPGSEKAVEYEHPHWMHHRKTANGPDGVGFEGEGMEPSSGGKFVKGKKGKGKGFPGVKMETAKNGEAYGPVTLNTLGATVHITPFSFSSPGGPQMTPAHIGISAPQPSIAQAPLLPQAPQYPQINPYALSPLPSQSDEEATLDQQPQVKNFEPLPSDCEGYAEERCKVFLDWPTDENNEIKASLRFKQNWHPDYRKRGSTKYKIIKAEVEKALKDVYSSDPNFVKAKITGFSEEDMKTTASFTLKFTQAENGALRYLSRAINANYLQSMPVYSSTLLRDGLKHTHRNIIPSQKELDTLPSPVAEEKKPSKKQSKHKLLDETSPAFQGCYRDRMPDRDLPVRFSKFDMTPEWCVGRCKLAGYKFAGLQYAYLCFCGNRFGNYGAASITKCSSRCYGDKNRHCGAFWHNSIYSIDGQKHQLAEFANQPDDDDDDDDDDDSGEQDAVKKLNGPGHADVANHLMKAAEAALKAAKKLLPQGRKSKRMVDSELEKDKSDAVAALGAAQELMNGEKERDIQKREAEADEGRNLLVAFLGNVGGYDRKWRRDVDSQEDDKSNARKFEYRRMVIDESGDGEFVEKEEKEQDRRKRDIVSWDKEEFDGPRNMAARSVETPASIRREKIAKKASDNKPQEVTQQVGDSKNDKPQETRSTVKTVKPAVTEDKPKKKKEKSAVKEDKVTKKGRNPVSKADKPKEKATIATKKADKGKKTVERKTRSIPEGDVVLRRRARDVEDDEEEKTKTERKKRHVQEPAQKRNIWLDDSKVDSIKENTEANVKKTVDDDMIFILKSEKPFGALRDSMIALKEKTIKKLEEPDNKLPANQLPEAEVKVRKIIEDTLKTEIKQFFKTLKGVLSEYGQSHAAVAPQASEAEKAILDIPVTLSDVQKVKAHLRKRREVIEAEAKAEVESLPSILKEHFKRNTDVQEGHKKKRRSLHKQTKKHSRKSH
ncbi:uncharacterized protein LOC5504143 isoform X2 [Nematostella vectensis]|uniref:uncharacterized protein LOC5504143 isoform X2 n=1 Tax=Nematostella vectensis TaxID=45351 RepID=UPI0020773473|nr:uncharacterized protein LOC5504143 isoform X2 [Nematostella vectensis]